ncbi:MAG: helix-turn-helix domain-containing protein, partial [Chloroflexi bacterium]|nr:helix-turn-helix domain-containing protein [Chloroflexota bacterium]
MWNDAVSWNGRPESSRRSPSLSRIQSIERAFAVLGALAGGPLGVTEVAERVDLPKSTAARLLSSLSREGAVEQ